MILRGPPKCPYYKWETERDLTTKQKIKTNKHGLGFGGVKTGPQAQECGGPPGAGRDREEILPWLLCGSTALLGTVIPAQ